MANPCWQPLPNCLAALTYATRSFARGQAAIEVTATPYTPACAPAARPPNLHQTLHFVLTISPYRLILYV
eukprot:5638868-Amphidinium_carterae.1